MSVPNQEPNPLPFPLPDPGDELIGPFWANAAEGRLTLPWCDVCSHHVWYPRAECPACGVPPRWTDVPLTGVVVASTVVHHAFLPAYAHLVPFATGLVEIDDTRGCRLATRFLDASVDGIAIGTRVRAEFVTLEFPGVTGSVVAPLYRAE